MPYFPECKWLKINLTNLINDMYTLGAIYPYLGTLSISGR